MYNPVNASIQEELDTIQDAGLYKKERIIVSHQAAEIKTNQGIEVLNFCANNYLGLSSHPDIPHSDMAELEEKLKATQHCRRRLIATDGVFSMDGDIALLDKICDLADKYNAMVMVDDCHASGFIGKTGRGSAEYHNVMGRVDIITGTFGKALGGASGGFTAASKEIVGILRQRSRPYLFSNTLAPAIVGASNKVLDMLSDSTELRDKLESNTQRFRKGMKAAGFDMLDGDSPIVPIMLYDAKLSQDKNLGVI